MLRCRRLFGEWLNEDDAGAEVESLLTRRGLEDVYLRRKDEYVL